VSVSLSNRSPKKSVAS